MSLIQHVDFHHNHRSLGLKQLPHASSPLYFLWSQRHLQMPQCMFLTNCEITALIQQNLECKKQMPGKYI